VEADNDRDSYILTRLLPWVATLAPAAAADAKRLDALAAAALLPALKEPTVERAGVPGATLQALRFLLAADDAAAKGPGAFAVAGDAELERRVALALVHACESELKALGTTAEEDAALLAAAAGGGGAGGKGKGFSGGAAGGGGKLSEREATAVRFRLEKKGVLRACLAQLRA
jgi:hypothetical protein